MRKSTCQWALAMAILLSVGMVAMVGCESGGSSSSDSGGGAAVLASGSTVITGGGHKLATVTAPSNGSLRWTVTRVGGGTGIVGVSADIMQGATTLKHDATQGDTVSIQTAVTTGASYDLFASTSDTDVSITYMAQME